MSNSYEKQLTFGDFRGICQAGSGHNLSLSYAHDGYGFITYKGEIMSMNPLIPFFDPTDNTNVDTSNSVGDTLHAPGTIAVLYKRFEVSGSVISDSNKAYLVFIDGAGYVWYKLFRLRDIPTGGWTCANTNAPLVDGNTHLRQKCSCVAYEINYAPPETLTDAIVTAIAGGAEYYYFELPAYEYRRLRVENGKAVYDNKDGKAKELGATDSVRRAFDAPVDGLFIANQKFGLACLYAPLDSDALTLVKVHVQPENTDNEIRFGAIELYNDRLWGTMIEADPDKLMYSAPKDPFNWDQFDASPADGAGDVQQPNFNGDEFVMLKRFGTSLLAIKSNGIWRVTGTNPSNYSFAQQYGEQELIPNTAVVYGSYMYVMGNDDILRYNGYEVETIAEGFISSITSPDGGGAYYSSIHLDDFAVMDKHIYCVYLEHSYYQQFMQGEGAAHVLVEYNTITGEINVRQTGNLDLNSIGEGGDIVDLLHGVTDETNAMFLRDDGAIVTRRKIDEYGAAITALPFYYESGYQNLSASNVIKGGFDIYLRLDRSPAPDENTPTTMPITVGIRTEKKLKTKQVVLTSGKPKRVHINNNGRYFRLELSAAAQPSPWRILGNITVNLELDYD